VPERIMEPVGSANEVRFDVVIIGSGAGGGTMAHALADTGVSVLLLERGGWLPMEPQNADPVAVWQELRYRADDPWVNGKDEEFRPFMHYVVGGNTKVWGAALLRLRESDFGVVDHAEGPSPAWPIDYATLAPWYDRAERLYQVHGALGDPTDPPRGAFPYPPVPHEPEIEQLVQRLRARGLHPSHLPLGMISPGEPGGCILCNTCNSFPCQVRAKSDTDVICVTDAVKADNVTLWAGARADRLVTDQSGNRVEAVEVMRDGERFLVRADTVVLSAGAVNSAALLLRSKTHKHPYGLANSSDLVGRRYMAHIATMMEAVHPTRLNATSFQKTVAINDFYLPGPGRPYPLGHIQSQGRAHAGIVKSISRLVPLRLAAAWVDRGVDFLAMSEDLPDPDNRVTLTSSGQIKLDYRINNLAPHQQLVRETVKFLKGLGYWGVVRHRFKNENTTHQCGTAVFGDDPRTSVLDTMCRTHDVDNLYVVDASFFPSSGAVNPGLTIIAQSLRVADHLRRNVLNHSLDQGTNHSTD
jgi:choline dehydrogenase-like flavoprotein